LVVAWVPPSSSVLQPIRPWLSSACSSSSSATPSQWSLSLDSTVREALGGCRCWWARSRLMKSELLPPSLAREARAPLAPSQTVCLTDFRRPTAGCHALAQRGDCDAPRPPRDSPVCHRSGNSCLCCLLQLSVVVAGAIIIVVVVVVVVVVVASLC
jgi:hypothetical protein